MEIYSDFLNFGFTVRALYHIIQIFWWRLMRYFSFEWPPFMFNYFGWIILKTFCFRESFFFGERKLRRQLEPYLILLFPPLFALTHLFACIFSIHENSLHVTLKNNKHFLSEVGKLVVNNNNILTSTVRRHWKIFVWCKWSVKCGKRSTFFHVQDNEMSG